MIKKNVKIKTIENVAQEKIDAIKLESHVHAVKNGKHVNVTDEWKYHATKLRSAIDSTILWAKKEKLGKKTIQLLDTFVDGANVFLTNLVKEHRK